MRTTSITVFLTDGLPTVGVRETAKIVKAVPGRLNGRNVRITPPR